MPSITPTLTDADVEAHRRALTGYCYRMLGSASEAEDAVQETLLRAWRSAAGFEGRSSLRTWLFSIAHNICVDEIRSPRRRHRPTDLGSPTRVVDVELGDPGWPGRWIEPIRDDLVNDPAADPAELALRRETIRLAFVAALQHLPPRQRAALVLCEVLRWPVADTAELLGTTRAAVNSALQRARATLAARSGTVLDSTLDPGHRVLLDRYVDAFERYDMDALATIIHHDAVLSMPPQPVWLRGRDELLRWFSGPGIGCRGGRLVPVTVNGTAGFGNYRPDGPGRWAPFALQVVECSGGWITGHHNFLHPEAFAHYGLPVALRSGPDGQVVAAERNERR